MSAEDDRPAGSNARPLNDTIAGTGPGIADDALAPGETMPVAPTDEEVAAAARRLGAPVPHAGDTDAHRGGDGK